MFGFLNVYKPVGMTSHDVVAVLRRVTKVKQIGHTGTLDPFAQGVLPIAIGKATRLIEFLEDDKEYIAEVSFGKITNTYDCEGESTFECESKLTQSKIIDELEKFKGEISQLPPIFSAIKVKGKKLYEYARKGEEVHIEPRKVFIEKIELKHFDEKTQTAQILISCSKGTYIRSIAHDLGQNLKVGAHLSKLIRTKAGAFLVEKAIKLEDFDSIEKITDSIINPISLINIEKIEITEDELKKINLGQPIENKEKLDSSIFVLLIYNDSIKAIAFVEEDLIKVKKVFV